MKNKKLNQWLWKWHVIAGLISAPFIVLLAITGGIYLFKDPYGKEGKDNIVKVIPSNYVHSYEEQRNVADSILGKAHSAMIVSFNDSLATQFISGNFGDRKSIYIDPYSNKTTGIIATPPKKKISLSRDDWIRTAWEVQYASAFGLATPKKRGHLCRCPLYH